MATLPNMNLVIPTPSVTLGPDWADQLNTALGLVDAHDHSTGKGAKVTPTGLNINADLPIGSNNLTGARSVRLSSNGAVLALPTDVGCIFNVNGDLFWSNNAGTAVQLTSGSAILAASDGISRRLERTAINSNTTINPSSTYSYLDVDTGTGVTITLPAANGVAAGRFYEIKDSTGQAATNNIVINRAGSDTIDGATSVTLNVNYQSVRFVSDGTSNWHTQTRPKIADSALQTAMLADSAVTTAKINNNAVTQAKRAALGQQISSSSGTVSINSTTNDITNLSVTITTTGRPVFIGLVSDGSANDARMLVTRSANGATASIYILEGSTVISRQVYSMVAVGATTATLTIPPSGFWHIYVPAAGTYTYKVQGSTAASVINADYMKLVAYEL